MQGYRDGGPYLNNTVIIKTNKNIKLSSGQIYALKTVLIQPRKQNSIPDD
jgi:hypothetical protein